MNRLSQTKHSQWSPTTVGQSSAYRTVSYPASSVARAFSTHQSYNGRTNHAWHSYHSKSGPSTQGRSFTSTWWASQVSSKAIRPATQATRSFSNEVPPKRSPLKTIRSVLSVITKSIVALTLVGSVVGYLYLSRLEGFNRSIFFWKNAFPIYLHYRFLMSRLDFQEWLTKVLHRYEHDKRILSTFGQLDHPDVIPLNPYLHTNDMNNTTAASDATNPSSDHIPRILPIDLTILDHPTAITAKHTFLDFLYPILTKWRIHGPVDAYRDDQFEILNQRYAKDLFHIITTLRGFYIKIGQLGSLRKDFLPQSWVDELTKLQSDCPYDPWEQMEQLLINEIGEEKTKHFKSINPIPLGAASIGQAHLAELQDGTPVVIKLQYPGVEDTFVADMFTIKLFCKLVQPEHLIYLEETERQFMTEFNYLREAENLQSAYDDLLISPFSNMAEIPLPLPEYCTKNVLVMTLLKGEKLADKLLSSSKKLAAQQGLTLEEFMKRYKQTPPPTSMQLRWYRVVFAVQDFFTNIAKFVYNVTVGTVLSPYNYSYHELPLNIRGLMHAIYDFEGWSLFFGHNFNADCHPGNIMYLENDKLGFIDYGQTKALSLHDRAMLAQMYIAFQNNDLDKAAFFYLAMGHRSRDERIPTYVNFSILGFDYDDDDTRLGMNIEAYFEYLNSVDPIVSAPNTYVMPGRVSLLLRGFAAALSYPIRASDRWGVIGEQFLTMHPYLRQWSNELYEHTRQTYETHRTVQVPGYNEFVQQHFAKGQDYHDQHYQQHFSTLSQHFRTQSGPYAPFTSYMTLGWDH